MRNAAVALVVSSVVVGLVAAGCKLSPEARAARARALWAEKSVVVKDRLAALEKAGRDAAAVDDGAAEFVLGARPKLALGYPRNTLIIDEGERALPRRAATYADGKGYDVSDNSEFIAAEVGHAVEEIQALRYLAVVRRGERVSGAIDENKAAVNDSGGLDLAYRGGGASARVVVVDLEDGAVLGAHTVTAQQSSTVTGSYVDPRDNMKADLEKNLQNAIEAWLSYGTSPKQQPSP
jgi:hypothetical protein